VGCRFVHGFFACDKSHNRQRGALLCGARPTGRGYISQLAHAARTRLFVDFWGGRGRTGVVGPAKVYSDHTKRLAPQLTEFLMAMPSCPILLGEFQKQTKKDVEVRSRNNQG
jgi:hypothetical protein